MDMVSLVTGTGLTDDPSTAQARHTIVVLTDGTNGVAWWQGRINAAALSALGVATPNPDARTRMGHDVLSSLQAAAVTVNVVICHPLLPSLGRVSTTLATPALSAWPLGYHVDTTGLHMLSHASGGRCSVARDVISASGPHLRQWLVPGAASAAVLPQMALSVASSSDTTCTAVYLHAHTLHCRPLQLLALRLRKGFQLIAFTDAAAAEWRARLQALPQSSRHPQVLPRVAWHAALHSCHQLAEAEGGHRPAFPGLTFALPWTQHLWLACLVLIPEGRGGLADTHACRVLWFVVGPVGWAHALASHFTLHGGRQGEGSAPSSSPRASPAPSPATPPAGSAVPSHPLTRQWRSAEEAHQTRRRALQARFSKAVQSTAAPEGSIADLELRALYDFARSSHTVDRMAVALAAAHAAGEGTAPQPPAQGVALAKEPPHATHVTVASAVACMGGDDIRSFATLLQQDVCLAPPPPPAAHCLGKHVPCLDLAHWRHALRELGWHPLPGTQQAEGDAAACRLPNRVAAFTAGVVARLPEAGVGEVLHGVSVATVWHVTSHLLRLHIMVHLLPTSMATALCTFALGARVAAALASNMAPCLAVPPRGDAPPFTPRALPDSVAALVPLSVQAATLKAEGVEAGSSLHLLHRGLAPDLSLLSKHNAWLRSWRVTLPTLPAAQGLVSAWARALHAQQPQLLPVSQAPATDGGGMVAAGFALPLATARGVEVFALVWIQARSRSPGASASLSLFLSATEEPLVPGLLGDGTPQEPLPSRAAFQCMAQTLFHWGLLRCRASVQGQWMAAAAAACHTPLTTMPSCSLLDNGQAAFGTADLHAQPQSVQALLSDLSTPAKHLGLGGEWGASLDMLHAAQKAWVGPSVSDEPAPLVLLHGGSATSFTPTSTPSPDRHMLVCELPLLLQFHGSDRRQLPLLLPAVDTEVSSSASGPGPVEGANLCIVQALMRHLDGMGTRGAVAPLSSTHALPDAAGIAAAAAAAVGPTGTAKQLALHLRHVVWLQEFAGGQGVSALCLHILKGDHGRSLVVSAILCRTPSLEAGQAHLASLHASVEGAFRAERAAAVQLRLLAHSHSAQGAMQPVAAADVAGTLHTAVDDGVHSHVLLPLDGMVAALQLGLLGLGQAGVPEHGLQALLTRCASSLQQRLGDALLDVNCKQLVLGDSTGAGVWAVGLLRPPLPGSSAALEPGFLRFQLPWQVVSSPLGIQHDRFGACEWEGAAAGHSTLPLALAAVQCVVLPRVSPGDPRPEPGLGATEVVDMQFETAFVTALLESASCDTLAGAMDTWRRWRQQGDRVSLALHLTTVSLQHLKCTDAQLAQVLLQQCTHLQRALLGAWADCHWAVALAAHAARPAPPPRTSLLQDPLRFARLPQLCAAMAGLDRRQRPVVFDVPIWLLSPVQQAGQLLPSLAGLSPVQVRRAISRALSLALWQQLTGTLVHTREWRLQCFAPPLQVLPSAPPPMPSVLEACPVFALSHAASPCILQVLPPAASLEHHITLVQRGGGEVPPTTPSAAGSTPRSSAGTQAPAVARDADTAGSVTLSVPDPNAAGAGKAHTASSSGDPAQPLRARGRPSQRRWVRQRRVARPAPPPAGEAQPGTAVPESAPAAAELPSNVVIVHEEAADEPPGLKRVDSLGRWSTLSVASTPLPDGPGDEACEGPGAPVADPLALVWPPKQHALSDAFAPITASGPSRWAVPSCLPLVVRVTVQSAPGASVDAILDLVARQLETLASLANAGTLLAHAASSHKLNPLLAPLPDPQRGHDRVQLGTILRPLPGAELAAAAKAYVATASSVHSCRRLQVQDAVGAVLQPSPWKHQPHSSIGPAAPTWRLGQLLPPPVAAASLPLAPYARLPTDPAKICASIAQDCLVPFHLHNCGGVYVYPTNPSREEQGAGHCPWAARILTALDAAAESRRLSKGSTSTGPALRLAGQALRGSSVDGSSSPATPEGAALPRSAPGGGFGGDGPAVLTHSLWGRSPPSMCGAEVFMLCLTVVQHDQLLQVLQDNLAVQPPSSPGSGSPTGPHLLVTIHGVKPPPRETVDGISRILRQKLAEWTGEVLSTALVRNPQFKLTMADVALLLPWTRALSRQVAPAWVAASRYAATHGDMACVGDKPLMSPPPAPQSGDVHVAWSGRVQPASCSLLCADQHWADTLTLAQYTAFLPFIVDSVQQLLLQVSLTQECRAALLQGRRGVPQPGATYSTAHAEHAGHPDSSHESAMSSPQLSSQAAAERTGPAVCTRSLFAFAREHSTATAVAAAPRLAATTIRSLKVPGAKEQVHAKIGGGLALVSVTLVVPQAAQQQRGAADGRDPDTVALKHASQDQALALARQLFHDCMDCSHPDELCSAFASHILPVAAAGRAGSAVEGAFLPTLARLPSSCPASPLMVLLEVWSPMNSEARWKNSSALLEAVQGQVQRAWRAWVASCAPIPHPTASPSALLQPVSPGAATSPGVPPGPAHRWALQLWRYLSSSASTALPLPPPAHTSTAVGWSTQDMNPQQWAKVLQSSAGPTAELQPALRSPSLGREPSSSSDMAVLTASDLTPLGTALSSVFALEGAAGDASVVAGALARSLSADGALPPGTVLQAVPAVAEPQEAQPAPPPLTSPTRRQNSAMRRGRFSQGRAFPPGMAAPPPTSRKSLPPSQALQATADGSWAWVVLRLQSSAAAGVNGPMREDLLQGQYAVMLLRHLKERAAEARLGPGEASQATTGGRASTPDSHVGVLGGDSPTPGSPDMCPPAAGALSPATPLQRTTSSVSAGRLGDRQHASDTALMSPVRGSSVGGDISFTMGGTPRADSPGSSSAASGGDVGQAPTSTFAPGPGDMPMHLATAERHVTPPDISDLLSPVAAASFAARALLRCAAGTAGRSLAKCMVGARLAHRLQVLPSQEDPLPHVDVMTDGRYLHGALRSSVSLPLPGDSAGDAAQASVTSPLGGVASPTAASERYSDSGATADAAGTRLVWRISFSEPPCLTAELLRAAAEGGLLAATHLPGQATPFRASHWATLVPLLQVSLVAAWHTGAPLPPPKETSSDSLPGAAEDDGAADAAGVVARSWHGELLPLPVAALWCREGLLLAGVVPPSSQESKCSVHVLASSGCPGSVLLHVLSALRPGEVALPLE